MKIQRVHLINNQAYIPAKIEKQVWWQPSFASYLKPIRNQSSQLLTNSKEPGSLRIWDGFRHEKTMLADITVRQLSCVTHWVWSLLSGARYKDNFINTLFISWHPSITGSGYKNREQKSFRQSHHSSNSEGGWTHTVNSLSQNEDTGKKS